MFVFPLKWLLVALPWLLMLGALGFLIDGKSIYGILQMIVGGAWATYQVKKWRASRK